MYGLWKDLLLAMRRLLQQPFFAAVAILTLAIGVGANSAIFTLAYGLLLRPLPFPEAERLVAVNSLEQGTPSVISGPIYLALRERNRSFSGIALSRGTSGTLTGGGEPERIRGVEASGGWFGAVGVAPLVGRGFTEAENQTGADGVIVLSEGLWRERFGADPAIVGRTLELEGRRRTVLGVMPAIASYPHNWRYWVPIEYTPSFQSPRNVYALSFDAVARLRPGITLAQASADVARIESQVESAAGMASEELSAGAMPLHEWLLGEVRRPLLVLMGAVGLVLLIACANLANLLLAQTASRAADFAIRRSLGARPGQIARQTAVESLVLGLAGGAAGLLVGTWTVAGLLAMLPPGIPRPASTGAGLAVLSFTFAMSLLAAFLFGLAPVLQARRDAFGSGLRAGARSIGGRGSARTRGLLVVAETAVAFALVLGAGLLLRSLDRMRHVDPGFRSAGVLACDVSLPVTRYDSDERLAAFWQQVGERLAAVPGVRQSGAVTDLPLGGDDMDTMFDVAGQPPAGPDDQRVLHVRVVTPGYLDALGIPVRRGRTLDDRDRAGAMKVALISQAAVERYFGGVDPIGKTIVLGWSRNGSRVQGEVVGVVGNVLHTRLRDAPAPEIYLPVAQVPRPQMSVVVQANGDRLRLERAVAAAVHGLDADLAVSDFRLLQDVVESSVATDRFLTRLLTALGAVAVALAIVGIFGVISYGVAQRRREIGVRMAVGASRAAVLRLVLAEALRLSVAGVVLGAAGATLLTRALRGLLFGVGAGDPATYALAAVVLLACAAAAGALPALQAARTPPRSVLSPD